jgi:hypothetical protein
MLKKLFAEYCFFSSTYLDITPPVAMSGNLTHVLFENASGYALFEVTMQEEIAAKSKAVQEGVQDLSKFQKMVKLKSFLPFGSAAEALQNANDVSEGESLIERSQGRAFSLWMKRGRLGGSTRLDSEAALQATRLEHS